MYKFFSYIGFDGWTYVVVSTIGAGIGGLLIGIVLLILGGAFFSAIGMVGWLYFAGLLLAPIVVSIIFHLHRKPVSGAIISFVAIIVVFVYLSEYLIDVFSKLNSYESPVVQLFAVVFMIIVFCELTCLQLGYGLISVMDLNVSTVLDVMIFISAISGVVILINLIARFVEPMSLFGNFNIKILWLNGVLFLISLPFRQD